MRNFKQHIHHILLLTVLTALVTSCKKWVSIDEPRDTLATEKMFLTDAQAETALMGLYGNMIHGPSTQVTTATLSSWAAGLSTYAGGLSAGELYRQSTVNDRLSEINMEFASSYWTSAYNIIYLGNAVVEGIGASKSNLLREATRKHYTAEAKLLRALSYFYLVNFFGDVPLALTIDFYQTKLMTRTPKAEVYQQILLDLEEAYHNLPGDYAAGQGKRVRVNKWVAAALLARTHLYLGQYDQAASYASEVIGQSDLFQLEALDKVFRTDSREAIFQLMQTNQHSDVRNATPEGYFFLPNPLYTGSSNNFLTENLLQAFEAGDQRKRNWTDSTLQTGSQIGVKAWYPSKYKTGKANSVLNAPQNEYYMVIRLAEMYLIRAEARANGADGGFKQAIEDLNAVRKRTELLDLPNTLGIEEVKEAVWHERQVELFAEWGHRWLDLKRSGKAAAVLSAFPNFSPWDGDWQLLYPIPQSEIVANPNLVPNPGYDQLR